MTSKCETCGSWIVRRKTVYGDGTEVVTWDSVAGKGHCRVLDLDTVPEFGCLSHDPGEHVEVTVKEGEPWQNWTYKDCPDCEGRGSTAYDAVTVMCKRCVGTGRVRHYDDGFVGEEMTRRHPKEGEPCTPTVDPATILKPIGSGMESLIT